MFVNLLLFIVEGSMYCLHVGTVPPTSTVSCNDYLHTVSAHPPEDPSAFLRKDQNYTYLWSNVVQPLNTKQVEAMKKAMQYKFSLIQGPPGICNNIMYIYHSTVFITPALWVYSI